MDYGVEVPSYRRIDNEKKTKKPSRLSKNTLKTAKRLLKYVTETYKLRFVLVFRCDCR